MKSPATILIILIILISCKESVDRKKTEKTKQVEYQKITNQDYELFKPNTEPNAVLILFGGYQEMAKETQREFKILESSRENKIAVVFSNYNQKLWLEQEEKEQLTEKLHHIFFENRLPKDNIYIGGFSSGGDLALLISNYLIEQENLQLIPKGVFIVDSPVDLAELYFSAEKNIKRDFSEVSVQESNWLVETLGNRFGNPNNDLSKYEKYSVFTLKTGEINNLKNLKDTKIRMYTEPDTIWWRKNRMADYKQMNAYHIKKLAERLKEEHFRQVEYIPTNNRGYRANGERHPHSWAIVEPNNLIDWMLNEK